MKIEELPIKGAKLITLEGHHDERGTFRELFKKEIIGFDVKQVNYSSNNARVIRGLHAQKGMAKAVVCIKGSVRDYILDLRPNSPTSGQSYSVVLDSPDKLLIVPEYVYHGFFTVDSDAQLVYACSRKYKKEDESNINFKSIMGVPHYSVISEKDRKAPMISEVFPQ